MLIMVEFWSFFCQFWRLFPPFLRKIWNSQPVSFILCFLLSIVGYCYKMACITIFWKNPSLLFFYCWRRIRPSFLLSIFCMCVHTLVFWWIFPLDGVSSGLSTHELGVEFKSSPYCIYKAHTWRLNRILHWILFISILFPYHLQIIFGDWKSSFFTRINVRFFPFFF